ncbi:MAG: UDP-N-acetylglucosamine 2-epimerase (non-hydrolyzing) [Weeksellaceae bacterium]|nr:UDP-N-acetylglucosamine 2-epimerase (non-hydrolyzing) [Weeksellaceae bacterium]
MKKILICFGTRPEAIKMASLVHELKKSQEFSVEVCVTGQHREMLDQVLDFFEIIPDYDLNIMKKDQTLNELSGRLFTGIDKIYSETKPDLVLVHGDTTTSSVCAWAAFHRGIKVGHIEAGLRTFDKLSPFPEEVNRQITGRIADFHFAPTAISAQNLLDEKIDPKTIEITGNTVIDSLLWTKNKLDNYFENSLIEELKQKIEFSKKIILVTGHRRENFGTGFRNICYALLELSKNPEVEIVYPVHLNPHVQKPVLELLSGINNIHLVAPLDYPAFVWMMSNSYFIITDSGGVQEEAPSLGKPVLVMRNTTERPEAVAAGTVILVGTDVQRIVEQAERLLNNEDEYIKMKQAHNPYGNGKACLKIREYLENII